ncbi:class I SAM-dependent methyltransferase [Marinicrinis sediminis]|uniref:Class I SAM-dependent methyltransferase n=1 Tax=Marinicrinis sediminis TaxID=1652465 RepID=A0ABW5RAD6_9BACL
MNVQQLNNKRVIFFGTGELAKKLYHLHISFGLTVAYFVDNNRTLWGTSLNDCPILSPDQLGKENKEDIFILVCSSYFDEISKQLTAMGFMEGKHFDHGHLLNRIAGSAQMFEPGHFYSPIPDLHDVIVREQDLFDHTVTSLPGVDCEENNQLKLLGELSVYYHDFPYFEDEPTRYRFNNLYFEQSDAYFLYSMMRKLRPKRMIEVGSGFSSAVMLDVNERFFQKNIQLTFIEPHPERLHSLLTKEDQDHVKIYNQRLQDTDFSLFDTLEENDILFIDSSHVSKIGSDVNDILFQVLPRLNKGVVIHFHDIFYPFEYPKPWIMEGRAWNEAYLLKAFLQYNDTFRILIWNHYLASKHAPALFSQLPICQQNTGGSLYIQKVK